EHQLLVLPDPRAGAESLRAGGPDAAGDHAQPLPLLVAPPRGLRGLARRRERALRLGRESLQQRGARSLRRLGRGARAGRTGQAGRPSHRSRGLRAASGGLTGRPATARAPLATTNGSRTCVASDVERKAPANVTPPPSAPPAGSRRRAPCSRSAPRCSGG